MELASTTVGRIITAVENHPEPGVIDFGFMLLALSGKATKDASMGIDRDAKLAREDEQTHDIYLRFDSPNSGFTVHCSIRS